MADETSGTEGGGEGGGMPQGVDAAEVPRGGWAIVVVKGLPSAPMLNEIEGEGFEVRHIVGPLQTPDGLISQVYVKRVSQIVTPPRLVR